MDRINQQIEISRTSLGSLGHAPRQKTSSTGSEGVDHDEKRASIQLREQNDILFRKSLGSEHKEDRTMIRRVKGVDQIKKELSRYNPPPTLLSKDAKQLAQLAHCIATSTEALLCIINQTIVFRNTIQAHINDLQE